MTIIFGFFDSFPILFFNINYKKLEWFEKMPFGAPTMCKN